MVDSPHHPEQEVIFTLTEAGVSDPDSDIKKKSTKITKSPKVESEVKTDVTTAKLAANAVTAPKVESEVKTDVTTAKLAANAVTAPKSDSSVDVDSKTEDSE